MKTAGNAGQPLPLLVAVVGKKRAQPVAKQEPPTNDRSPGYATLPLRYFLGATFVYAGLQKIADPGFLQPGASTYIGTQLEAFAAHSPIGFLLDVFALPTPQLTGIGVIAVELTVGALVIAGIATRWAAAVGALVSLAFFLTASWSVQPYFLGSDSIYAVAWITLALVGDHGILTARPLIFGPSAAERGRQAATDFDRRRLLLQLGGAAVAAVWVLAVLPRSRPSVTAGQPTTTPSTSPSAVASPTGIRIGALSDLQAQGFLNFQDPASGDPAVAVSLSGGSVVAFDAVCTHAGCLVGYDASQRLLSCPCHGAVFDPSRAAAVVSGPAPTPLAAIKVQVGTDGGVYAG
ncbi:MAG: DoxX family membrane protein [Chloroflexi bacterium]|nr:MAG: DoxX family membrane protein [Chloroflexota bacterium]